MCAGSNDPVTLLSSKFSFLQSPILRFEVLSFSRGLQNLSKALIYQIYKNLIVFYPELSWKVTFPQGLAAI